MAMNKFRRTNFYVQEEVDEVLENDLVNNYWDLFKIKREMSFVTIGRTFIARPDLLSLKVYGIVDYWWILCKHNKIDDVWNDMTIGDVIEVPDVQDINDWFSDVLIAKKKK